MTEYKPIFRSPITGQESAGDGENLKLADLSGVQIVWVQGKADDILQKLLPVDIPTKPGDLVDLGAGLLARLTPAEFYLFGKSFAAKLPTAAGLDDSFVQAGCFAHATDYTHGKAVLKLSGPAAGEVLSKTCGLNFYDTAFPNMQARQTSAAKIKTLIARCDEDDAPTYFLHVERPLGQYFWQVVWDAGGEYGIGV